MVKYTLTLSHEELDLICAALNTRVARLEELIDDVGGMPKFRADTAQTIKKYNALMDDLMKGINAPNPS